MNWTTHPSPPRTATRAQQRAWRQAILTRDNHTCQINGPNCTHHATEADHITPVSEGGNELALTNGTATCTNCHKNKTQTEATQAKNRWKLPTEKHPGLK